MNVEVRVECYSGYKADERPLRFHLRGREFQIEEILDRWYSPDSTWFRVRADDGHVYVLRHDGDPLADRWTLESFRREDYTGQ